MKVVFEIELDEKRPQKRSSGGNPKWVASTEFEYAGLMYAVFIDVYQKGQQKQKAESNKPVVKAKAS